MASKDSGDTGRGIALVLILIELFGAFFIGKTLLDSYGPENLQAAKFSTLGAGLAGIFAYIVLHIIPGIRWLMMVIMVALWAVAVYSLGLILIGENAEGLRLVSHKGPYIAAGIAALFRALMYRS